MDKTLNQHWSQATHSATPGIISWDLHTQMPGFLGLNFQMGKSSP